MKMVIQEKRDVSVEVDAIRVCVGVNYDEEDMPNDYPFRKGDTWDVTIDLHTGQIRNWPKGVEPLDLSMKVVDCGSYYLMGDGKVIASIENDYVPDCFPGDHYGDYIMFRIDGDGRITNWPNLSVFGIKDSFKLGGDQD